MVIVVQQHADGKYGLWDEDGQCYISRDMLRDDAVIIAHMLCENDLEDRDRVLSKSMGMDFVSC